MLLVNFLMISPSWADDGDIFLTTDADGNVTVDWVHPECVWPNPDWEDHPYKIKYREVGELLWNETFYSDGSVVEIPAEYLEHGGWYEFKVKYYGRNSDCGGFRRTRTIGKKIFHYDVAIFHEVQIIPGVSQKIHGVMFDRCMYPYTWPGGSVDSVRIFHWGCYSEDIKAFIIDDIGSDMVRMKSQTLGFCIIPKAESEGDIFLISPEIGVGSCDLPNTVFVKEPVDPGAAEPFKLRNQINNRCLFATDNIDGAPIQQNTCSSNDHRQNFYFEDF